MARYIDATQLQAKILDAKIANKLPESREVLTIFDNMVRSIPTADVAPKSEVERAFSDLKKQIHDNAVYPKTQGVNPYISIRTFDAILNNVLKKHTEG